MHTAYTFSGPAPAAPAARRRRAITGFTVAEVMIATFVLALGISASITTLQSGFKALDTARNTTLAAQIIQSEMERIRLLPWLPTASTNPEKAISTLPDKSSVDVTTIFPTDSASVLSSRFTVTRTSADVTDRAGEMKQIAITVTWTGIDGQVHTRSTFTQYSKNGLYDYYYTKSGGS